MIKSHCVITLSGRRSSKQLSVGQGNVRWRPRIINMGVILITLWKPLRLNQSNRWNHEIRMEFLFGFYQGFHQGSSNSESSLKMRTKCHRYSAQMTGDDGCRWVSKKNNNIMYSCLLCELSNPFIINEILHMAVIDGNCHTKKWRPCDVETRSSSSFPAKLQQALFVVDDCDVSIKYLIREKVLVGRKWDWIITATNYSLDAKKISIFKK